MASIFISYRREDAAGWAGRLAADLRREFPHAEVFHDIASIDIGEDFVDWLFRALETCAVAIVLIGPRWLNARDDHGQRRLDDPKDLVRLEIQESLQRPGLRVVPLLVGSATMPREADLPDSLQLLARRNAHEMSERHWDYDLAQLVKALQPVVALAGGPKTDPVSLVVRPGEWLPGKVFRDGDDGPEMVVIPAGEFLMGSPESEAGRFYDEGPQRPVRIGMPFALGRYPVMVGEFKRFAEASGYQSEAECDLDQGMRGWDYGRRQWVARDGRSWRDPGFAQLDRHPVVGVSWNDALAYVQWLVEKTDRAYRLPSEAEWEYSARAGATTAYPWGDEAGSGRANFFGSGSQWSGQRTSPVGSFAASAFGLHDMIGNVWEWLPDCWNESYLGAPNDGRPWETGACGRRVVRGGSWDFGPAYARAACRYGSAPGSRVNNLGFRLARTL